MTDWQRIRDRARQFLEAAEDSRRARRLDAGFEDARTSAELSAKALLQRAGLGYPSDHNVAGVLHQAGLTPLAVNPKQLSRLLRQYTRGNYGFDDPVSETELDDAIALARAMLEAL